jgi:hypothetical protein
MSGIPHLRVGDSIPFEDDANGYLGGFAAFLATELLADERQARSVSRGSVETA